MIEAQIVQKRKDNEARPKFTGSYKKIKNKKRVYGSTPRMTTRVCALVVVLTSSISGQQATYRDIVSQLPGFSFCILKNSVTFI